MVMLQVDSKRVTQQISFFSPPGTPLAKFFEEHQLELEEATRSSQEMLSEAARIHQGGSMLREHDLHLLFGNDPGLCAKLPLNTLRKQHTEETAQGHPPKPKKPVGVMVKDEIEVYIAELTWIFSKKKNMKARDFRKWPLYSKEGHLLEAATSLDEWDESVEVILPRQYYKGPHKGRVASGVDNSDY